MRHSSIPVSVAFLIIPLFLLSNCSKGKVETIRISGSTTITGFMLKAVEAYHNHSMNVPISVTSGGSKKGIADLIQGTVDVAMSSAEISQEQIAQAKEKGISLKAFLLGYDVVVPVVNPANFIDNITITQLKNIYIGRLLRWNHIGGADTVIDVVDRGLSSGTHAVWHHALDDIVAGTSMKITESRSNSSVLAYVAEHENSIGYLSAAYLNPEVKALKLDGIDIRNDDSLLSRYNLKRPLLLYVNESRITPEMKGFISFLLLNSQGRSLLDEAGFFPVYSNTNK